MYGWGTAEVIFIFPFVIIKHLLFINFFKGNTYSRKHSTLNPEEEAFWDFSWDELGKYDVGKNSLFYQR